MPIVSNCAEPGCREHITPGEKRCPRHRRTNDQRRGSAVDRGYTADWTIRAALFRQRFPLCGDRVDGRIPVHSVCYFETPRRLTIGDLVDHVIPHRGDQNLFWDESNWQTLCRSCHGIKTAKGL